MGNDGHIQYYTTELFLTIVDARAAQDDGLLVRCLDNPIQQEHSVFISVGCGRTMGAAGSVGVVDPAALRKEYEAMAAKDVGDEELLNHMKKLIISPQTGGCIGQHFPAVVDGIAVGLDAKSARGIVKYLNPRTRLIMVVAASLRATAPFFFTTASNHPFQQRTA